VGKLIAIIGNVGAGKTTLANVLAEWLPAVAWLEQHAQRPYQARFAAELQTCALQNQIDYLLFRAGQEVLSRRSPLPGIFDGGLDLDFELFTRLFHQKHLLSQPQFEVCANLHKALRLTLPCPDLIINLQVPLPLLQRRMQARHRPLEAARQEDLPAIQFLIDNWRKRLKTLPVIDVDAATDDPSFAGMLAQFGGALRAQLD
jgi:deoxyadenosine/deoxycytidine kinase